MDRTPPVTVRRALRAEVGFGCPMPGCANPYLEYHHFDPPWREHQHHEVKGMIALCAEHHRKADAGAFTVEQLRLVKGTSSRISHGRFDWLRNRMLSIVGGNFYYETPIVVQFRDQRQIWYTRDSSGYMLLNVRMITASGEPRLCLEENDWTVVGAPVDFESPPSGRLISVKYANGDSLRIEFSELHTESAAAVKYPDAHELMWKEVNFPITTVEIQTTVGGTDISFGPRWSNLGGNIVMGNFSAEAPVGLRWSL